MKKNSEHSSFNTAVLLQMSKFCCAPGCKTGSKWNETTITVDGRRKISLFKPPEDSTRRESWERLIPRKDFKLTNGKRVCELHFDERFIERNYVHVINGEKTEFARGHPKLSKDAIPTIFPNLPKYLSKTLPKRRTSPSTRLLLKAATQKTKPTSSVISKVPSATEVSFPSSKRNVALSNFKEKLEEENDSVQVEIMADKTSEKRMIEPIISIERAGKDQSTSGQVEYRSNEEWSALLDQRIMEICILKMSVRNLDKKVNRLKDKCKTQKTLIQKLQRQKCTNCFNVII